MKIIDKYILKRYLATFSVMLLMFIPIGITIDVSEKVNKMIEQEDIVGNEIDKLDKEISKYQDIIKAVESDIKKISMV